MVNKVGRPKINITSRTISMRLADADLIQFDEYVETVKDQKQFKKFEAGRWVTNITAISKDLILRGLNKNTFETTNDLIDSLVEKRVDEETEDAVKKLNSFGFNDKQKNNLESHLSFNTAIIQDVVRNIHDDQTSFTSTIISLVNKMSNQVEKNNTVMDLENKIKELEENNSIMELENKIKALEENKLFDEKELDRAYGLIQTLRGEAEERKILFAELTNKNKVGELK